MRNRQEITRLFIYNHIIACLLFAGVYIWLTWPLALHFQDSLQATHWADGWEEIEQFWWYKHALVDEKISPIVDPKILAPEGWNLVSSPHPPALMIPTIPFTVLFGAIGSYNITMFLGFVFAALGIYMLVYRLTSDPLAGMVAGVGYSFTMSRLFRIGGHFNVQTASAWVPWVFLCLEIATTKETNRAKSIATNIGGRSYKR